MALELKTQINIAAHPQQVWEVFADFSAYPVWNPFIKSLKGEVHEGAQIEVDIDTMKFKPEVLSYKEAKELVWLGKLWFKGLFDGQHSFKLLDNGNGTTTFEHGETFKGILVPLLKKKLMVETKAGFEKMNLALKKRVEERSK